MTKKIPSTEYTFSCGCSITLNKPTELRWFPLTLITHFKFTYFSVKELAMLIADWVHVFQEEDQMGVSKMDFQWQTNQSSWRSALIKFFHGNLVTIKAKHAIFFDGNFPYWSLNIDTMSKVQYLPKSKEMTSHMATLPPLVFLAICGSTKSYDLRILEMKLLIRYFCFNITYGWYEFIKR